MYKSFTFNNEKKEWVYLLSEFKKPPFAPINRSLINVSGMDGAHLSASTLEPLVINVQVGFKIKNENEGMELKEEMASWLFTEKPVPLQFDYEPNRTYYAVVQNTMEDFEEFIRFKRGTIQFICLDPYKYGAEIEEIFTESAIIENPGTAESDPVFELEVLEPVTFAMVSNGDDYMMIGQPADDDTEIIDARVPILEERGETLDTWSTAGVQVDDNFNDVDGNMVYDGTGIMAESYGAGDKMHGPAIIKEITPIQDFEIETTFDIISNFPRDNYRMEVYFFDENMNMLGKMGINDNNRNLTRRIGLGRVGEYAGKDVRYPIGSRNYTHDNLGKVSLMYLRVKREGNKYTFYISEIRNSRHHVTIERTYNDSAGEFAGKLKYVELFIGNWQDRPRTFRTRINYVNVYELRQETVDQTPYIAKPGDIITFDHTTEDILLNGEDATEHKDFGGQYFKLQKGHNTVAMLPDGAFDGKLKFRPRYR